METLAGAAGEELAVFCFASLLGDEQENNKTEINVLMINLVFIICE
jgi:hypothetical protein